MPTASTTCARSPTTRSGTRRRRPSGPNVRFDNTAPSLVSSAPADGSVSTSANQIVLTASEPVTAPGALLDGVAAPAPTISGNQLTFATGALSEGLHVLSGELEDASGNRTPFRVAVTIESTPQPDRPPVEKSASPTGTTVLEAPGQLATVSLPASAWPALPGPKDFLVLHVDPLVPSAGLAPRLAAGSQVIEVTARWALAGTNVHDFDDVLEVLLPATAGSNGVPATSQDGTTWRNAVAARRHRRSRPRRRTATTATPPASTCSRATSPSSRSSATRRRRRRRRTSPA